MATQSSKIFIIFKWRNWISWKESYMYVELKLLLTFFPIFGKHYWHLKEKYSCEFSGVVAWMCFFSDLTGRLVEVYKENCKLSYLLRDYKKKKVLLINCLWNYLHDNKSWRLLSNLCTDWEWLQRHPAQESRR